MLLKCIGSGLHRRMPRTLCAVGSDLSVFEGRNQRSGLSWRKVFGFRGISGLSLLDKGFGDLYATVIIRNQTLF